jgi:hypothetical protein
VSASGTAEPLVDEAITTTLRLPRGSDAFLPCRFAVSRSTLAYLAGVVRRHRRKTGTCWRKLNPGQQALLVLVHLRKGETFAGLAAGFGVGTATAWRYVQEAVSLLAGPHGPKTSWLTDPDGYRIELVQWPPGHPDGITEADFS